MVLFYLLFEGLKQYEILFSDKGLLIWHEKWLFTLMAFLRFLRVNFLDMEVVQGS